MHVLLTEFKELVNSFHTESGSIKRRPSWMQLCGLASKLSAEAESVFTHLDQKDGLALCLAANSPGKKRNRNLLLLFTQALEYKSQDAFINLLSYLSHEEIIQTLLPFIYEPGNKSSSAVYLAAKLGIIIKNEVFKTFLATHQWSRSDHINLSLLVIPEDKQDLILKLEDAISNSETVTEKTAYASFKYILETNESNYPIAPELSEVPLPIPKPLPRYEPEPIAEPEVTPSQENNAKAKFVKAPDASNRAASSPAKNKKKPIKAEKISPLETAFKNQIKVFTAPELKSNLKEQFEKFSVPIAIGTGSIAVIFLVLLLFNALSSSKPETITAGIPSSWTDTTTNRTITQDYLAADVDYRMGELYLSRNYYGDALKLFEDALHRDKTHLLARIRSGICYLNLREYDKALNAFDIALSQAPNAQFVNMYIARIYRGKKDFNKAISHYKKEMRLETNIEVGVEYATFLESIGEHSQSMEVLHDLQSKFPDKVITLNTDYHKEDAEL